MAPINDILSKLESKTALSRAELNVKIKQKQDSLSGLISEEGAAYLVAKDMGVDLTDSGNRKLEIKNIIVGMRNVAVAGRVFKLSDIIDFRKSNGSEGRVVNLFVGDKTGFVRIPLWNDQVKLVEDEMINFGDIVQISGAYAQENIYGDVELSLGKYGEIFNITDEALGSEIDFPSTEDLIKNFLQIDTSRSKIKDINPGKHEIRGTVIDVIKSNFIFWTCPECGKTVKETDGQFECESHGNITPEPKMYISFMIDDGTGIMRIVSFREIAERISDLKASEIDKLSQDEKYGLVSGNVVGKEYIVEGNVKKNTRYDKLEMIANAAKPINVSEESEKLMSLLKMKLG